jgi:radical SAM superfamily enzyme YgiQ (UPF0313 family)
MSCKTLFIIPPFTQLNTPYPATAYLKGFLDQQGKDTVQVDLSIELFCKVFSSEVLSQIFEEANALDELHFIDVFNDQSLYIDNVDDVIQYLQGNNDTLASQLLEDDYLPIGHRLSKLDIHHKAYQALNEADKAKHIATLFIEEIGDFIKTNIDEFFSFTKYAEQIASSASSFDQIADYLQYDFTLIEEIMLDLLEEQIQEHGPDLVSFTIPFPGNLFASLRCAQHIKTYYPTIKVAFGGGYCNTELRSLEDPRIFQLLDFITLDDGEGPLLNIIEFLEGNKDVNALERTFMLQHDKVVYHNHLPNTIHHHSTLPAPNYEGLFNRKHLSFLDVINPMHRLWSDEQWLKLTVSHGCYWKQCSFCDVNLDYIGNYQNTTAEAIIDKMEQMIEATGINGFHFVDEAAPPKMLKAIALELIERKISVRWWTNIRFEKTFDFELCKLLAASGCIAVTGGLEVASDRLLKKMKKGVDIAQVARVTKAFKDNGILVHAYLMYGFPTQTEQETIDALEVVRQLFDNDCLDSAFWHRFTCTIHSPIGQAPSEFDIEITGPEFEGFAQNDLTHIDLTGADHGLYTIGLNTALEAYLEGNELEKAVSDWFDIEVPTTKVDETLVSQSIA